MPTSDVPAPPEAHEIALRASRRIAGQWRLCDAQAADLFGMTAKDWQSAKEAEFSFTLNGDQLNRISAVLGIYRVLEVYFPEPLAREWMKRPNNGPLSSGKRPVDFAIAGGPTALLQLRGYLEDRLDELTTGQFS